MLQANFSKSGSAVAYRQMKGLMLLSRTNGVITSTEKRYFSAFTRRSWRSCSNNIGNAAVRNV